jgi:hypothetical protein
LGETVEQAGDEAVAVAGRIDHVDAEAHDDASGPGVK